MPSLAQAEVRSPHIMQTAATSESNTAVIDSLRQAPAVNFGNGRFSEEMKRIYQECFSRFNIDASIAEKIARACGSDAGQALAKATAEIKLSAMDKKGNTTIKDASKMKGVEMTPALAVARALQWVADAGKNGVSYGHTTWVFTPAINDWIETLK